MIPQKLPPPPGFLSPDFWLSFLTVVCTFILNQWGVGSSFLRILPGGDSWLPIVIVAGLCIYMAIKTYVLAKKARDSQSLPPSNKIEVKTRDFIETSEFWLGLTVTVIKLLQDNNVAGGSISDSITTSFLILAIVYALSRSQLKQAYLKSLLFKVTRPEPIPSTLRTQLIKFWDHQP